MKRNGLALVLCMALLACGQGGDAAHGPREIVGDSACSLDGMLLAEYPGPKGQIQYEGQPPEWFCDTLEIVQQLQQPEQKRRLLGAWVQDMGKADWAKPRGHWTDARTALYVVGSKRHGGMGPTLATFAERAAAEAFAKAEGGKVKTFAQLGAEDVRLDGGVLHDQTM